MCACACACAYGRSCSWGCGRGAGDRQFFYINGRPVDLPKVSKLLNELYRTFCPNQCPVAVLDFKLPTDAYDVNVTPAGKSPSCRDTHTKAYAPQTRNTVKFPASLSPQISDRMRLVFLSTSVKMTF